MEDRFKNKYRIPSTRLSGWDYGSNALYYITVCTQDRMHYFGEIVGESDGTAYMEKTTIGAVAHNNQLEIPKHFDFIELDEFVFMPNHLHGILYINKPDKNDWQANKFGAQSGNLGSVMRGYKASVKAYSTTNEIEFGWQPRYHDHIIRNEKEYLNIVGYIRNNPQQWLLKGDNEDNIFKP